MAGMTNRASVPLLAAAPPPSVIKDFPVV